MKRKLVKQGSTTMMISLPTSWVKNNNLNKGDEVDINDMDNDIVISTSIKDIDKKCILKGISTEKAMGSYLGNAYRLGFDTVEIHANPQLLAFNKANLDECMGFEIHNQTLKSLTLKNIAKIGDEQFDTMLNRMFLLIKIMGTEIMDGLRTKNKYCLEGIDVHEKVLNKLHKITIRICNTHHSKIKHCMIKYLLIYYLEHLGDSYKTIAHYILNNKCNIDNVLIDYINEVFELAQRVHKLYSCFSIEYFENNQIIKFDLIKKGENLLKKNPRLLSLLLDTVSRTGELNSPISSMHIDNSY